MKKYYILILVWVVLLLVGCGNNNKENNNRIDDTKTVELYTTDDRIVYNNNNLYYIIFDLTDNKVSKQSYCYDFLDPALAKDMTQQVKNSLTYEDQINIETMAIKEQYVVVTFKDSLYDNMMKDELLKAFESFELVSNGN